MPPLPFPATNNLWTPLLRAGIPLGDPLGDESPASTDIVGDSTYPAAFFAYDGTYVFFRLRVNGDPRDPSLTKFANFAWGIIFDTDNNLANSYEWLLVVDGSDQSLDLVQNTVKNSPSTGFNDQPEGTGGGTPNLSQPIVSFDRARVVIADSNFGGNADYFVDWGISFSVLQGYLGITSQTLMRFTFFTATNHQNLNKDTLGSFTTAFTNPVTVESSSIAGRLTASKTLLSGPAVINVGTTGSWTLHLTVNNPGKSGVSNTVVNDQIDLDQVDSLVINSISQGTASYQSATRTLTWTVGYLAAGASATMEFTLSGRFQTAGLRTLNTAAANGTDSYLSQPVSYNFGPEVKVTAQMGQLQGLVADKENGFLLREVHLILYDSSHTQIIETTSSGTGAYGFPDLIPGDYWLRAEKDGYHALETIITVSGGTTTFLNLSLEPDCISLASCRITAAEGEVISEKTRIYQQVVYSLRNHPPGDAKTLNLHLAWLGQLSHSTSLLDCCAARVLDALAPLSKERIHHEHL